MTETNELIRVRMTPQLDEGTLILGFSGWMDGGEVSTGTVERLVQLLTAEPVAEIESEPFYLYNFPGPMEIAALFRPHIEIEDGLVRSIDMPAGTFYAHEAANLLLFVGKEPNLRWQTYAACIFDFARSCGVRRLLFVGSFGGAAPHTREPPLYVTCSSPELLAEMHDYGVQRTGYEGPGSFSSYLMSAAPAAQLEMISLVVEVPGYLQGPNPACMEAIGRRLAKILQVSLDLDSLRTARTQWELQVTTAIDENAEMAEKVRELEEQYDNELLEKGHEEA